MNGNEITNHLNAAIVACELAKSKLLPMTDQRFPDKVNKLTIDQWQTVLWRANNHLVEAQIQIQAAENELGVTREVTA